MVGAATILTFVVLLYFVELIDQMTRHSLDANGIRPLELDGLWGIVFSPALARELGAPDGQHGAAARAGFPHDAGGLSRFVWATAIVWILGGLGTWLIGDVGSSCGPTDHIGASGLIFGWLAFLLVFGIFVRRVSNIVIGLVVMFAYGGVLLGAMPVLGLCGGVSWQAHLCGAIAGVVAAYWLSAPERKARTKRTAGTASPRRKT